MAALMPHPAYGPCGLPLIYSPRWLTLLVLVISKSPGGATAYRGYSTMRFGSPEKAQRAASGKTLKKVANR
ncbi:hypothetical protein EGH56_01780 [Klebsiella aerogenes]|jgi:hypothetical protein|nr:hypothetical protein AM345_09210 [Klebsiella aerogenes]QDK14684.1 hypothetical protein ES159_14480 [Klebsiella aerogenes]RNT23349.1 hypothetical protein B9031_018755 [Klebsiella aerogenes]RSV90084.1 hypothetical protein EGH56_01780 [Klebsiella aerogenes]